MQDRGRVKSRPRDRKIEEEKQFLFSTEFSVLPTCSREVKVWKVTLGRQSLLVDAVTAPLRGQKIYIYSLTAGLCTRI